MHDGGVVADIVCEPHHNIEATIAFQHHAGFAAAEGDGKRICGVAGVHALRGCGCAIHHGCYGRLTGYLFDADVRCAGDGAQDSRRLFSGCEHGLEVVAIDLHGDIRPHAGDQLVEAHLDRLRELVTVAQKLAEFLFHAGDKIGFGQTAVGPRLSRFQHDKGVGNAGRHRIGRNFGRARAREDQIDFRHGLECSLDAELHLLTLLQRGRRNAERLNQNIAFIQRRREFPPERQEGENASHQCGHG